MTKSEYADYEKAVAIFLKNNDVKSGCHSPKSDNGDTFFSWKCCECCGSGLGGTREEYVFARNDSDGFEADICINCVYYLAYGKLDDATMLEIGGAL